jgi:hypothetical protein
MPHCGDVERKLGDIFVMNCVVYDLFQTILGLSDQKRYALMGNVARSRDVTNLYSLV